MEHGSAASVNALSDVVPLQGKKSFSAMTQHDEHLLLTWIYDENTKLFMSGVKSRFAPRLKGQSLHSSADL